MVLATLEALLVQDDGLYGVVVITVFESVYMLLFFLRFRAMWVITAFLNTFSVILSLEALVGEGLRRGIARDVIDLVFNLASLILLLTPQMRAYFFKRERAPKIPPRPDIEVHAKKGWRQRLGTIPTPWSWQRNWPQTGRLNLIKIEGTRTAIYPAPEAKERSWFAVAGLALVFGGQVILAQGPFLRIFGALGLMLVPFVALRLSRAWKGPALLLDDVGLKNLFIKKDDYIVLWGEVTGLRIKKFGGTRFLLIDVLDRGKVLRRQSSKLVRWSLRLNAALGFSVVSLPALHLPIKLERLAWMIFERIDASRASFLVHQQHTD
jgi:hypothetical protein